MFQTIWNSIWDNIPWWAYVVAAIVALAFTYQFWAPVWALLPKPVKVGLGVVAAAFTAFVAGRNRGAANARAADKERTEQALNRRLEVNKRVEHMTPSQVDAELDKKGDFRD